MKRLTIILMFALAWLSATETNAQRRYVIQTVPCADGKCVPAVKPAMKASEELGVRSEELKKTSPREPETQAEPVEDNKTPHSSLLTPNSAPERLELPRREIAASADDAGSGLNEAATHAEIILRGDCTVSTDGSIRSSMANAFAQAVSLPADDNDRFYCTLFYGKEDIAECKALLNAWKKSEKLRAIADPVQPQTDPTKCKFSAVHIDDVTQRDLVAAARIGKTPCVIIQTPKHEVEGLPADTLVCRMEGFNGDVDAYAADLLAGLQEGVKRLTAAQFDPIEMPEPPPAGVLPAWNRKAINDATPNIAVITTLEKAEVESRPGRENKRIIPKVKDTVDNINETVDNTNGLVTLGKWAVGAVLVFFCLCILQKLLPPIFKLLRAVWRLVVAGLTHFAEQLENLVPVEKSVVPDVVENVVSVVPTPEIPPEIAVTPAESDAEKIARLERSNASLRGVNTRLRNDLNAAKGKKK